VIDLWIELQNSISRWDERDVLKAWLSWWILHVGREVHLGLDFNKELMEESDVND